MDRDRYLDHLAYFFTMFRWILVYIDVVVIALAIPDYFVINLVVAGITGVALVFNVAVGIADRKAQNRIPGEVDFPTPRYPVITSDFVLGILYLAFWAWMLHPAGGFHLFYGFSYDLYYTRPRYRFYLSAFVLSGTMVMWHFHLIFAIVNIIRRRRIIRIVEARRLGPMSMANDDQDWTNQYEFRDRMAPSVR